MKNRFRAAFSGAPPLLLLLAAFAGLTACQEEAAAPPKPTPKVRVALPLTQETMDWDDYTGRVQAIQQVEIRSRVSGYINTISFTEGSLVKEKDPLFIIDPRPYEAELQRAEADLERAKAQAALAKLEFDRARTLTAQKVISVEEFDAKSANASQSNSNVRSAEAAVETAKLNLSFCYITAPVSGKVSSAKVTVGNLVQPGGEVLTTIVSQDPMYVYVDADENAFLRYKKMCEGKSVAEQSIPILLELSNETGYPHRGTLDFFDNRVDPNTGTIRMRGVFKNADGFLTPGLFCRVRVPGSAPYQGMLLPDSAINTDQSQKYVLTVGPENKVVYNKVELGPLNGGMRVIKSGIKSDDRVILAGFHMAQPGTVVEPQLEEIKLNEPLLGYLPPNGEDQALREAAGALANGHAAPEAPAAPPAPEAVTSSTKATQEGKD